MRGPTAVRILSNNFACIVDSSDAGARGPRKIDRREYAVVVQVAASGKIALFIEGPDNCASIVDVRTIGTRKPSTRRRAESGEHTVVV